jgi:hypothetical protein
MYEVQDKQKCIYNFCEKCQWEGRSESTVGRTREQSSRFIIDYMLHITPH